MKIKELIAKPENYTRLGLAYDKFDNPVDVFHPNAHKFSLIGAMNKCYPDITDWTNVRNKMREVVGDVWITEFAHNSSYTQVLGLVERLDV